MDSKTVSDSIEHGIGLHGVRIAQIGMYASWACGGAAGSTPYKMKMAAVMQDLERLPFLKFGGDPRCHLVYMIRFLC